jgi:hypothetical protein
VFQTVRQKEPHVIVQGKIPDEELAVQLGGLLPALQLLQAIGPLEKNELPVGRTPVESALADMALISAALISATLFSGALFRRGLVSRALIQRGFIQSGLTDGTLRERPLQA